MEVKRSDGTCQRHPFGKREERDKSKFINKQRPFRAGANIVMKQLFQIIAFYLFGFYAVQVIVAIGIIGMLLQILVNRISGSRKKRRNREIESYMWLIE